MDVNCALYLLQLSSAQKWKNRHLKQCTVQYVTHGIHIKFIIPNCILYHWEGGGGGVDLGPFR